LGLVCWEKKTTSLIKKFPWDKKLFSPCYLRTIKTRRGKKLSPYIKNVILRPLLQLLWENIAFFINGTTRNFAKIFFFFLLSSVSTETFTIGKNDKITTNRFILLNSFVQKWSYVSIISNRNILFTYTSRTFVHEVTDILSHSLEFNGCKVFS